MFKKEERACFNLKYLNDKLRRCFSYLSKFIFFCIIFFSLKLFANTKTQQITIPTGSLLGTVDSENGIISFKGIPYAAPPIGALRWKEPQPVKKWKGIRDATKFGAKCWTASPFGGPVNTKDVNEDCLFLNIWTPAEQNKKLPVMVFIHGGGFQFGSASDNSLDGTSLAKKGVVLVTINYRLGVFGFLARTDLDKETKSQSSGMYGTLDQIAALRWIKQNISSFGGDPDRVTLFGESAGAHSVGILMASPLTKGFIHRAIGESGAFWESENGGIKSKAEALKMGEHFGKKMKAKTIKDLRKIPALALQNATPWSFAVDPSVENFSPSLDGYVLPTRPYTQFLKGKQNDIPLLVGWNANEGQMFLARTLPNQTAEEFTKAATKVFGKENLPHFLQLYPASTLEETKKSAESLIGDIVISFQTWSWANIHKKTGTAPVYVYYFKPVTSYTPVALHIDDIPYVFGNFPVKKNVTAGKQDLSLSESIQMYWTNFARTGDPNGNELPTWPVYKGAGSEVMQLGNVIQAAQEEGTEKFQFLNTFRTNDNITIQFLEKNK